MTQTKLFDLILTDHPFVYRNNRGCVRIENRFIRFGIPEPKTREQDEDIKGSDFVGFTDVIITPSMVGTSVPVFTCIEAKTKTDVLKLGQKKWHNFILSHGGISQIWEEKKDGINIIEDKI